MNEILSNLVVIAVVALLVILLFVYLQHRRRQKDAQFAQMAQEKGWQLERVRLPLISGYRLTGKNAAGSWILETLAEASPVASGPGSSDISHHTRWWTESVRLSDRSIAIGPLNNPDDAQMFSSISGQLLKMGLRKMLGEDVLWATSLSPIEIGRKELKKRFLFLANQKDDVEQLIQPEVEKLLLTLAEKHKPVIKFRQTGLEISLPNEQLLDRSSLEMIINLGNAITISWKEKTKE
jgi:hypothetical protein